MATEALGKILLIEDDPDTRANLRDILEMDGYEVETASTACQAMDRHHFGEFLAVLLDRWLPDGNADTLLPQIKQLTPDVEVVILTGHADMDGTITALRHGAADFLPKPIDADVLRTALARVARVKEAERRAQQAERLAAIGQMAAVLAHEGRNALLPLAYGHALLASMIRDRPDALDVLGMAEAARNHVVRLFDDLCCYAGTPALRCEALDLGNAWRTVWAERVALQEGRIVELVEDSDGAPLLCDGDRFRMEQVFRNLLDNALAACPDPVQVKIRCSEAIHRGRPALRLVVADNGPGLTLEQRQKAFEPFYTTKSEGTGLGLAICQKIIEAHGGEISLGDGSSGAEFIIVLPRKRE